MGIIELGLILGLGWTAIAAMAIALGVVAKRADDRRTEALARQLAPHGPAVPRQPSFARRGRTAKPRTSLRVAR